MLRSLILLLIAALPLLAKPEGSSTHYNKHIPEGISSAELICFDSPAQPAEYCPSFEVEFIFCARKKFGQTESIIASLKKPKYSFSSCFDNDRLLKQHRNRFLVIRVLRI
jgi:hypothetical protein